MLLARTGPPGDLIMVKHTWSPPDSWLLPPSQRVGDAWPGGGVCCAHVTACPSDLTVYLSICYPPTLSNGKRRRCMAHASVGATTATAASAAVAAISQHIIHAATMYRGLPSANPFPFSAARWGRVPLGHRSSPQVRYWAAGLTAGAGSWGVRHACRVI